VIVRILRAVRSSALGSRRAPLQSAWQVIGWWEARRLVFNLIVGAAGIGTAGIILIVALISERLLGGPIGMPDPPIVAVLGVVLFAAGANVCYTGGWLAELLVKRAWPDESEQFGASTFAMGLIFAVAVTLAPVVLVAGSAVAYGLARWLGWDLALG